MKKKLLSFHVLFDQRYTSLVEINCRREGNRCALETKPSYVYANERMSRHVSTTVWVAVVQRVGHGWVPGVPGRLPEDWHTWGFFFKQQSEMYHQLPVDCYLCRHSASRVSLLCFIYPPTK